MSYSEKPISVTKTSFQTEVLESDIPVVVDLWAPWCGPCRMIGPVLEELAERHAGRVKVVKVNTDEEKALASEFRIRGIPTLLVYSGGHEIDRTVGFRGAKPLEQLFRGLAASEGEPTVELAP